MLSKEETTLLIRRAKDGDNQAKEELVKANSPLIKCLIKRYLNKGIEYEPYIPIMLLEVMKKELWYRYGETIEWRFYLEI